MKVSPKDKQEALEAAKRLDEKFQKAEIKRVKEWPNHEPDIEALEGNGLQKIVTDK